MLHISYGMSYADISRELKISRSTVQKFIERAKAKVMGKGA
ncbi:sigma factor-like helix-turn-helix DNA-binding protein [Paenibacillus sp. MBLB4367]